MPIKKDRFEARVIAAPYGGFDLTAMLELRQGSFGNPFSYRQGVRGGINSPPLRYTPCRCRTAQMGNQDLRAVFPCQREYRCCIATCLQNIGLADPIWRRISPEFNLAAKDVRRRSDLYRRPRDFPQPAKPYFRPPKALSTPKTALGDPASMETAPRPPQPGPILRCELPNLPPPVSCSLRGLMRAVWDSESAPKSDAAAQLDPHHEGDR